MDRVDTLLEDLRGTGDDPRLEAIGDAVLAGLAVQKEKRIGRRALAFTGLFALGIGFAGGLMTPQKSAPISVEGRAVLVLNTLPASAPSTLLLGGR